MCVWDTAGATDAGRRWPMRADAGALRLQKVLPQWLSTMHCILVVQQLSLCTLARSVPWPLPLMQHRPRVLSMSAV